MMIRLAVLVTLIAAFGLSFSMLVAQDGHRASAFARSSGSADCLSQGLVCGK